MARGILALLLRRQYILVSYNDKAVVLTAAYTQWKKLHLTNTETTSLNNFEIVNNQIINATKINTLLSSFSIQHCTSTPRLIIEIPVINGIPNSLFILQNTLCLSKNFAIARCIQNPLSTTYHDTPGPHHHKDSCPIVDLIHKDPDPINILRQAKLSLPSKFLATSIGLVIMLTAWIFYTDQSTKKMLNDINDEITTLSKSMPPLQTKASHINTLKRKNAELERTLTTLNAKTCSHYNPLLTLISLSKCMPPHSWLTRLQVGHQQKSRSKTYSQHKKEKRKKRPITLSGITLRPNDINTLSQKLSSLLPETNLSLATTKKSPSKNPSTQQYFFTINGTIE